MGLHGSLDAFYASPLGKSACAWEELQYDKMVSDCFGYNAVQLGAPKTDFLKNNRIGLRIVGSPDVEVLLSLDDYRAKSALLFEALPFDTESIDLVVLPHTLEEASDPHALLREVGRVLIPGGRVVLTGFNKMSLWGIRQSMSKFGKSPLLPGKQYFSVSQVRDWLHLLSFHVDRGLFGCYGTWRAPGKKNRMLWLEKAGDRWWPHCGAVYSLGAVKKVSGFQFVGKALTRHSFFPAGAPAGLSSHRQR
ncbi:MAG: class I SAM-dependent methyltransferase [Burkholderiales bacterium]|nr:class I SAM-dependent methyltransferase [Burkholderiales bacterium]